MEKLFEEIMAKNFPIIKIHKFDETFQLTDPRSSMNLKPKKGENTLEHNQMD